MYPHEEEAGTWQISCSCVCVCVSSCACVPACFLVVEYKARSMQNPNLFMIILTTFYEPFMCNNVWTLYEHSISWRSKNSNVYLSFQSIPAYITTPSWITQYNRNIFEKKLNQITLRNHCVSDTSAVKKILLLILVEIIIYIQTHFLIDLHNESSQSH